MVIAVPFTMMVLFAANGICFYKLKIQNKLHAILMLANSPDLKPKEQKFFVGF